MRHAVLCLVLLASAPGLLLPGGIDVRMCFCGGLSGDCCMRSEKHAGCCRLRPASGRVAVAKADSRCPGCVRLTVPPSAPRAAAPLPTVESVTPDVAQVAVVPSARASPVDLDPRVVWHPPPGHRSLPLLI